MSHTTFREGPHGFNRGPHRLHRFHSKRFHARDPQRSTCSFNYGLHRFRSGPQQSALHWFHRGLHRFHFPQRSVRTGYTAVHSGSTCRFNRGSNCTGSTAVRFYPVPATSLATIGWIRLQTGSMIWSLSWNFMSLL